MTLPTFLGIGALRSGTTSLNYSLGRHPQIFLPVRYKEIHYFLRAKNGTLPPWLLPEDAARVPKTRAEYKELFSTAGPQHLAIGEFSPSYLSAEVAPRIAMTFPRVKLIVSLRHPVDQARSILAMWLGRQPSRDELVEWLEAKDRLGPRGERPLVEHGRYVNHLKAYFHCFPRDQIKVVIFEDLVADPRSVLGELQTFLGVDRIKLPLLHLNAASRPKSRTLAALLGERSKRIARAIIPLRFLRPLEPTLHRLQSANSTAEDLLDPALRQELLEEHYLASARQLALPCGTLPWIGKTTEKIRRDVA